MRRFSQRSTLVTLSDINITPLLDLAFVLLIIFVIISPSIRQRDQHGMDLDLPDGGAPVKQLGREDIQVVEIGRQGQFMLNGRPAPLAQIEQALVASRQINPEIVVSVRGDVAAPYGAVAAVIDRCKRNGINRIHLPTDTPASR